MAARSSTSPAGRPVTIATSAGPCDSPAVDSVSAMAQSLGRSHAGGPAPPSVDFLSPGARPPLLRAALEPCLQVPHVGRHLVPGLPADDERHEELADPMALEVQLDRHARPFTVVERLDRTLHHSSDGPVDTAN